MAKKIIKSKLLDTTSTESLVPQENEQLFYNTEADNYSEEDNTIKLHKIAKTGDWLDILNKPYLNTNNTESLEPNSKELIFQEIKLHKFAKTGNYNDLNNKPILNTNHSESLPYNDNILENTIHLHKVAKTGNYYDLANKYSLYSEDVYKEATYRENGNNNLYVGEYSIDIPGNLIGWSEIGNITIKGSYLSTLGVEEGSTYKWRDSTVLYKKEGLSPASYSGKKFGLKSSSWLNKVIIVTYRVFSDFYLAVSSYPVDVGDLNVTYYNIKKISNYKTEEI